MTPAPDSKPASPGGSGRPCAEATLPANAARFREALESAQIGSFELDIPAGRLAWSNRHRELWGYAPGEITGAPADYWNRVHPEDLGRVKDWLNGDVAARNTPLCEYRVVWPDGTVRWVATSGLLTCDAQGVPQRLQGVAMDISARKEAEMAKARTEAEYQAIFETALIGLAQADPHTGRFLRVNRALCNITGYSADELLSRDVFSITHPDDRERDRQAFQRVREGTQASHSVEKRYVRGDGEVIWGRVNMAMIRDPDGRARHTIATIEDVSERRRVTGEIERQASVIRTLLDSIPDLIFYKDLQGVYLDCNPAFAEFVGRPRAGILGRTDHDFFERDVADFFRGQDAEMLRQLKPRRNEEWVNYPDGRRILLDTLKTPYWGQSGQLLGVLGISRDITARVAAEATVHAHEARHRSLVETSFDWVWEIDADGRYSYASPRVKELLGYAPEEVIGRTPFEFMPEEESRRVADTFRRLAEARQPIIALENVNRHKDGRLVVVETNGVPILGADGRWLGYRGMDRDITARREAERTLRLHGAALEAAANAIVITDRAGVIEWANPAFAVLCGWTLPEVQGRRLGALVNSGRHSAEFFRQMWETITAGRVWRGEIVNRRRDGTMCTEDMTITPLFDERGAAVHFIAIKQDITERKLLETQNRQAQRMEAIGTLAGGIAHDLNNILSPILIVTGLLKDKAVTDSDQQMLAMLQQGAKRGADIIRQLLTFSRGLDGERVTVQVRHILKEIMAIMRETFPREIDLSLQVAPALPVLSADPTQLHQLVLNLCVNARDAMPDGGHLTLRAEPITLSAGDPELPLNTNPGRFLRLTVEDTGHGIVPEIRHRIFDPFYTTKPMGKGTGLGLSTVLGIARSHGGFVTVDSEVGRGSAFKVYFPATLEEAVMPAEAPQPLVPGGGRLILVVDDERNVREAFRMVLEHHGYRVLLAVNGRDALTQLALRKGEVALVLTDVMMPVMNGVALIKALRGLDPDLPVVATSGLGEFDQQPELAALGVPEVLMKPIAPPVLIEAIQRRLAPHS